MGRLGKAVPGTEMAGFVMKKAQFLLDRPISCLKGFIPCLRGPRALSGRHPRARTAKKTRDTNDLSTIHVFTKYNSFPQYPEERHC